MSPSVAPALWALHDADCLTLAATYGTPAFVYDEAVARSRWRALRAVLPARVVLAYAVKANPHPQLLACFARQGAAFDCASAGELEAARAALPPNGRLFFTGPAKKEREIRQGLALGARFQVESLEELATLDRLVPATPTPLAVNLRVHPLAGGQENRAILGGSGPSVFGVDEEELNVFFASARRLRRVRIAGLHVFTATNQRQASALIHTWREVFALGGRLRQNFGVELEQIDLGGGLGIPYRADEESLELEALGRGLTKLLAENPDFTGEVVLEPGRFLAGPCGIYLSRVVRTKSSRGRRFALLEGGINHLLRPQLTGVAFPVRRLGQGPDDRLQTWQLAGPLCTSLDRLGEVALPELAPGDLLIFGQTGAYGATEAMTHFLGHPPPLELWRKADPAPAAD